MNTTIVIGGELSLSNEVKGEVSWGQYVGATTAGYGVYAYSCMSNGNVRVYQRYNSNYSLTIDGTYHVEVYKLTYPDGVSPFE